MDQRVQFIAEYQRAVFDIAELARRYGISRKTAYSAISKALMVTCRSFTALTAHPTMNRSTAARYRLPLRAGRSVTGGRADSPRPAGRDRSWWLLCNASGPVDQAFASPDDPFATAAGALSAPDAPGDHRGPAGGAATPSDLGRQEAAEGGGDPTAHLDASSPEHGLRPVGSRGTHHSARAASGADTPGPAADPNDRAQRDVDGGL